MHSVHLHGVKLTDFQAMKFEIYIRMNFIKMTNKSARERKRIVIDFLSQLHK
jgi:hypothetical protein